MGNCQAIDTATLVIQQPNGKVERLYWPVSASEVMKGNPGHYVALLISSTTLCTSKDNNNNNQNAPNNNNNNNHPVRLTRIKLLKPTDTLVLGQVYRLISAQEVMKGLWAKKQAKMKKNLLSESDQVVKLKPGFDMNKAARSLVEQEDKQESNKGERHGSRTTTSSSNGGSGTTTAKSSRTWQPSLQSISEATT
ncbi:hypothetical protein HN51_001888 [Arachis hypogaea]|uniref:DUF4228 domain protein n=2 Tax=Arachis TaxID=3817 RepID=A0A445EPK9_ARAHY|nr:uncharacterized protein LOC107472057 [Arachis duranensis]XP_025603998.1 putative uncharacterized protein DDB_G0287413 [Arachis hypogaea]XP_057762943.1 uncharacterized protein LOC130982817 [Arachis stenosperma]QHO50012.1 uncharacterized protein DS421_1g18970 [Arachis hypogaea]RYR77415.1 hypothetical protein Ahy_A01g001868 [Arachis hypogaea]